MRAPSQHRMLFFWSCAAIVAFLLAVVFFRESQPSYNGKTITQWLYISDPDFVWMPNDIYGHIHNELWENLTLKEDPVALTPPASAPAAAETDPAIVAVQHMGTNAIPYLLRFISSTPTLSQRFCNRLMPWVPAKLQPFLFKSRALRMAERYHYAALQGFCALGSNAVPALPVLSRLLHRPEADFELGCSIAATGPEGRRVLVKALEYPESNSRRVAAFCLGQDPSAAVEAIPPLLGLVNQGHPDYQVLGAIGRLSGPAQLVVPALTLFLQKPDTLSKGAFELDMAILILGLYGEQAASAIPVLLELYPGADPTTRQVLRVVIKHIQPDQAQHLLKRAPSKEDDEDPWWNGAKN